MAASERYVPAAGRRAFTRLYDPVVALTMREATFRGRLGAQVLDGLAPGAPVVDVGCGTGTLAIALASGGAEVIGVDGDPEVLSLALAEAARVLRPGGRLHVADWGRPRDPLMRGAAWALQRVDGAEGLAEHLDGRLYDLLADAGLAAVAVHDRLRTGWGSLELLSARRPAL
jgi:SAM-dependent methyltransferase